MNSINTSGNFKYIKLWCEKLGCNSGYRNKVGKYLRQQMDNICVLDIVKF